MSITQSFVKGKWYNTKLGNDDVETPESALLLISRRQRTEAEESSCLGVLIGLTTLERTVGKRTSDSL